METCSERRKRKLVELAREKGGLKTLATDCGLSHAALDQIVKGVPLPPKADGTRSERSLGDDAARSIEKRYGLERGWFDSDQAAASTTPETLAQALNLLAEALQNAGRDELMAIERWLSAMAADPANAKNKSDLILKLLVTSGDKHNEHLHDERRGRGFSVVTPPLKLGDENGERDTNAAAGGKEK